MPALLVAVAAADDSFSVLQNAKIRERASHPMFDNVIAEFLSLPAERRQALIHLVDEDSDLLQRWLSIPMNRRLELIQLSRLGSSSVDSTAVEKAGQSKSKRRDVTTTIKTTSTTETTTQEPGLANREECMKSFDRHEFSKDWPDPDHGFAGEGAPAEWKLEGCEDPRWYDSQPVTGLDGTFDYTSVKQNCEYSCRHEESCGHVTTSCVHWAQWRDLSFSTVTSQWPFPEPKYQSKSCNHACTDPDTGFGVKVLGHNVSWGGNSEDMEKFRVQ